MNDRTLEISLTVNGARVQERVEARKTLVDFLREDLALTGSHVGCEHGVCGACTVRVNGEIVRGCLMLAVQCDGAAVETIDRSIGVLLDTLLEQKLAGSTVIIMSADHGGAGRSHGPNDPRSRHIPWICTGPGIRKGYDLTRDPTLTVNTEDTFATACWFLGIRPPGKIDGKPIEQVLDDRELLRDAKVTTTK